MPKPIVGFRYWPAYALLAVGVLVAGVGLIALLLALPVIALAFPLTISAVIVILMVAWGRRRLRR